MGSGEGPGTSVGAGVAVGSGVGVASASTSTSNCTVLPQYVNEVRVVTKDNVPMLSLGYSRPSVQETARHFEKAGACGTSSLWFVDTLEGKQVVTLVRPIIHLGTLERYGYLMIYISPEFFSFSQFNEETSLSMSLAFCDCFGTPFALYSDSALLPSEQVVGAIHSLPDTATAATYADSTSDFVCYVTVPSLDWKLVSSIPYAELMRPLRPITTVVIVCVSICLVLCVLISHSIISSITRPLHRMVEYLGTVSDMRFENELSDDSTDELRYLFAQLLELSALVCPGDAALWRSTLEKLPPLAVNGKGVYRVSPDEDLRESHRHFSHLMAIHPLRLTNYDTAENRRIIDACILDQELLGTGLWVGFSFAWMAELYAVQGNGEGAAAQLEIFWRYCCSPNGFHLNGDYKCGGFTTWHYRPFTLEGNMCAADALQEMLLFSEGDTIRLFPAIPARFETAEFENFRAQNGLLVSARLEGGRVTCVSIHAQQPCTVTLAKGAQLPLTCTGLPCTQSRAENGDLKLCFG